MVSFASVWSGLMVVTGIVRPTGSSMPEPLSWMALGMSARRAAVTVTLIGSPGLMVCVVVAAVTANGVFSRTAMTMLCVSRHCAGVLTVSQTMMPPRAL